MLCSLLALAATSAADIGAGNGEIGFDVGGAEIDHREAQNGLRVAVRGGYHLSDFFQLELQLSNQRDDGSFLDVTLTTATVYAVFNFRPSPSVVRYLSLGAGIANLEVEGFGSARDDDATVVQVAAGSRFFVTPTLAVRLELAALEEDSFDESSTHFSAVVGLTWRLGPRR